MKLNKEKISLTSTFLNALLGGSKIFIGLTINSSALVANGIDSAADVISSFFTFLGIRVAGKPVDQKHPYGYYMAEVVAGLIVTLFLIAAGIMIIYEGINRLITEERVQWSLTGIIVIAVSIVLTEIMARLKFKYGREEESLALVADAEHSRVDVISSSGVLIALLTVPYFWFADGLIALAIGLYILRESYGLGREVTDNLLGVKDEKIEERIKEICKAKNISVSEIKSRKIGAATFAEITIELDPRLKVEEAEKISQELQEGLVEKIKNLKYAVIQIKSHDIKEGFIRPRWGRRYRLGRGKFVPFEPISVPEKRGWRIMIPLKDNEIHLDFGAPQFLLIDRETNGAVHKKIIENPYFGEERAFGMRIVKFSQPDEIMTKKMGPGAEERAKEAGIKITFIPEEKKLPDILSEIEKV